MKEAVFHGVKRLASEFSKEMAQLVKIFPRHERYALADDLLRAARSIPANIAEGWGRVFPKRIKSSAKRVFSLHAKACHLVSCFLFLGTCFLELGTWFLVLGAWFLELGTCFLLLVSWFLFLETCFLVLGACFLELGSCFWLDMLEDMCYYNS